MSNLTPRERREAITLGNKITELAKLQKASHIAPRLPYSSVPEGNLVVTDSEGNVVDVVGPKGNPESGDQPVLPGREPSKPSAPLVSAYLGTITATWDGSYVEEYVAPDLLQIEVHSSTDDDFEASAGTLVGTITGQRGGSVTLAVEYGTHYVRFVAVSTSGSRSVESDIASVEVTPLVETIEMTEVLDDIDQRFGGVITEAQQLNDKLSLAELDIDNAQADLIDLETVRLPAVEANIEAAHQEIASTGAELGGRLTQAESDLLAHDTRIGQNKSDLTTLNNTTLPALNTELTNAKTRLTTAEGELSATKTRVTTAEGTLNTLENTTIPALNTDLTGAKNRLTVTETEITGAKTRLTDAESDLTDAFGQIGTAQTAAEAALADAAKVRAEALSRGNDLVTNGSGSMGDNTNFPGMKFVSGDQPTGTSGSFEVLSSNNWSKEKMTIDVNRMYAASVWARQVNPGVVSRFYLAIAPYDSDGLSIGTNHYMEQANTRTTLASDLKPGDTTITLTSSANWKLTAGVSSHLRNIIIWNYVDGSGKLWAPGTYSRNVINNAYDDGGISGNVITLRTPYAGALVPSGTAVGNGMAGGNYMYPVGHREITNEWVKYDGSFLIGGVHTSLQSAATDKFPVATSTVIIGALPNYSVSGGTSLQRFAGFSFSDITANAQLVETAQAKADEADRLAKLAQGTADDAITAASTAQTTADTAKSDAATAAGIAGGKADVLIQSTVPVSAMQKATTLWIDTTSGTNTPKRWSGSAWVVVTDKAATDAATAAATAQARADSAHTAAGNAQTTANNALTMAGSKNSVFYSTNAPSGTASLGDTWRQVNTKGDVIGEWRWTAGNTWLAQQVTTEMISNLDVGKLTAGSAIIQTAVVQKIAAQTATIIELNADRITAGTISADRLNVVDLAARIATVIELNADRITAGTIATGRLNATEVAAAVATVIQLNASSITSGTISTARLNATEIAASVATIINLNADRITSGIINTDRLNANEIAAKTAAFQTVDVKNLFATTGTMSEAVIEKLWTDVIRSRKITTDQLLVGQGENLIPWDVNSTLPDRTANFTEYGSTGNKIGVQAAAGVADGNHLYMDANWVTPGTGTNTWRIMSDPSASPWGTQGFKVEPEEEFQAQIYVKAGGSYSGSMPSVALAGVWYKSDGTYIVTNIGTATSLTWLWDKREVSLKAPATAAYLQLYVRQDQPGGVRVDLPSLYRKKGASLIVDGAIEAKHITASESMSAKVGQFLKLDVKDLVSTGTASLNQAVIDKLWTDVVHSKKITSDMVVIGGTNNVLVDTFFEDEDFKSFRNSRSDIVNGAWGLNPTFNLNWYGAANQPTDRSKNFYFLASSGIADKNAFIPVEPGSKWRLKAKTNSAGSGARFTARYIKLDGSTGYTGISSFASAGIVDHSEVWTIPSDFAYVQLAIQFNTPSTSCYVYGGASMVQMSAGELIVDGAITAAKIATNAVESDKIKANAITADKIAVGAIKAEHISARGITADKLVVGDGSNVFPDSFMKDLDSWNAANAVTVYTGGYGGGNRARVNGTTGQTGGYYAFGTGLEGRRPDVIPGRTYLVSCYVRPTVAVSSTNAIALFSRVYKKGDPYTASYSFTSPSVVYNGKALAANVWTEISGQITIPAGDETSFMPGLYLQSTFPSTGACDFSMYTLTEMVTGELVVKGAITADKLDADAITGKTITGGTITGANIIGSRYEFNGSGSGAGYNLKIENDAIGAYMGFSVPNGLIPGTIRAFDEDPWADYSTPTLVIRPPSVAGIRDRDAVKISAGIDGGSGGLVDVGGNLWIRGELRGRYQETNGVGRWTSLFINDVTSNYSGESPSIKSLGMYNRTYTYASNVYITSNGYMGRTTSLRDSKLVIEDIPKEQIDALLNVNPRWWFDKGDSERLAEYLSAIEAGTSPEELGDVPQDLTRIPGLVAEEVEASGATAFVSYDRDELGNKKLSGVNYDRVGPALIPLVREQRDKIRDLESRLEALEARFQ